MWAIARPPDYQQGLSGNPVTDLPSFELRSQVNGNYSGSWDQFTVAGTYQLAIYASDRAGNTSVPILTTVSVESPLSRRAILIAAGAANDPFYEIASGSTDVAFEALRQQGYSELAIYYMNSNGVVGFDVAPSLSNLESAITDLSGEDTQDLVLYIVGGGQRGQISLNGTETVTANQLASWLDTLTDNVPGDISVILDGDYSGSFISALSNSKRIIVTSTTAEQTAHFLADGNISFSNFYWREVFNGATVRDAKVFAGAAMRYAPVSQNAQLDDNGDGISSKLDGRRARFHAHGAGILLAGDGPLISEISTSQSLTLGDTTTIAVNDVTTTGEIIYVIATVTAPDGGLATYSMSESGGGYSSDSVSFDIAGTYDVAVYAQDSSGNLSPPIKTAIGVTEAGFELALNTDQSSYNAGEVLALSTQATIGNERSYTGRVDVYLSLALPDGTVVYITDLALSTAAYPQPILQEWNPSSFLDTTILSVPLPEDLPSGNYSWKLTFVRLNLSITDPNNWLAQSRAVFEYR